MSKNISISSGTPTDPEEVAAEQHVTQIMGPAWSNGSPNPEAVAEKVPEESVPPELPHESVPESTAPETTLETAIPTPAELPIATEADLNLAEPPTDLEAPKTEEQVVEDAVNDIITGRDAEAVKDTEITAKQDIPPPVVMKESPLDRFKEAFYRWWDNKIARYITLGVLLAVIGVIVGVPAVRTSVMNFFGFRASVSVYAVDATTLQPLGGVSLSASDNTVKTGTDGKANLNGVKLGRQTVVVHKAGFADVKQQVTFGFRAVDLGEVDLKATGLQLGFVLTDYLSGKPVPDVTLESGESSTKSDKNGKAIITLAPDSTADSISIHKNGYRTEQAAAKGEEGAVKSLKLVLAAKEVYVAKETGVYNLKKVDLDGKNTAVLLAGTGTETSSIDVSVDPLSQYAALISTRDNVKNKDGYLLSALTLVNISTGDNETIEHAEKLTIVGWSGTTLVYKQVVAGTSAANVNREKIMAYNYASDKRYQIAGANHFLGTVLHSGTVYFAVSSTDPNAKSGLMSAALDGSAKKLIQEGEAWALYQADYKTLKLQTASKWYSYAFGASAVETQAATPITRTYLDSGDAKLSIWSDASAAYGNLSLYDIATGKDQVVTKTKGQYKPIRWLNNRVFIYRAATIAGAADYVLNLDGGNVIKVADSYTF